MDFIKGDPVKEKFLRMGRKFRWFDMPLEEKIDALENEIKMSKEITCKKNNVDLTFTDNKEEMVLDDDNQLTTCDIVDIISDDENDDDIDDRNDSNGNSRVDNTGHSDESGDNNITDVIRSLDNEDDNDGDDINEEREDGGNDVSEDESGDDDSVDGGHNASNGSFIDDIVDISNDENADDVDDVVDSNGNSHVDNTDHSNDSGDNNVTNVIGSIDNENNNDGDDIEESDDGGDDVSEDESGDDNNDDDSVDGGHNASNGSFIDDIVDISNDENADDVDDVVDSNGNSHVDNTDHSNDSGDNNVTNGIGSIDNENNNDGDDIIEESDDGGDDVSEDESGDDNNDVDGGENGSNGSFIDDSNESEDNYVNYSFGGNNDEDDIEEIHVYEPDSMTKSSEINEECPSFVEHGIQPNISKDEDQVTRDKETIDELNSVEEIESMQNTDEHSFNAHDVKTSNTELFNGEIIESTTDGTGISEESQFVELPLKYQSCRKDHSTDCYIREDECSGDNDGDGEEEGLKYKDNEDETDVVRSPFVNSIKINDGGDLSTEELFMTTVSSMTDCSNNNGNSNSDSPEIPASLSARLLKKYNPEKSESDVDDFELFLQKIRTPKKTSLSEEKKADSKSLGEFIVNDGDDDLEEDVFVDPGFQEEFDFDSDKENDDCIEITNPVASYTPFKTPTDFSWKTPKTKAGHTGLSSGKLLSRPKSVLEDLLAPYSTEKGFKMNREQLAKDLFELYNRTVFDNQLPSDFQITWNKKMRSTAGFCYYSRKNGIRLSRIELADKVIDSSDRLRDTLIHEMCHAASWVISDVKAGHGPVWKKWTRRANFVHQDLPPISRCHSYTINTKYTYRCTKCENTFGRHSKSVNLEKSRCAYCHSRLELVPQLKKDGTPQTRTPSRFAMFVKENFARIKKDNETFSHQEVMKALSSEFTNLST